MHVIPCPAGLAKVLWLMMLGAGALGAPVGIVGGFAPGRVEVAGLLALCGGMGAGPLLGGGVWGSIAVDVLEALESTKRNVVEGKRNECKTGN